MTKKEKKLTGQDEMNIAEFPITALTRKPNFKPIVCEDEIEIQGKRVKRRWILSGDLMSGTPIATDEELIMFIQKYLCELQYKTDIIDYKTYEFLKLAKWNFSADDYLRHDLSLLRLFGTNIRSEFAFYDNEKKKLVPVMEGFHIIEDFKIYGKPRGMDRLDSHLWDNKYNQIRVSRKFLETAKINSTKVDLDYYFSLDKPISKRLFRFLNKRFYNTDELPFNIKNLCKNHLGMIGEYNLYELKRELNKAGKELTTKPYNNHIPYLKPYKETEPLQYKGEVVIFTKMPEIELPPHQQFLVDESVTDARTLIIYFHTSLGHNHIEVSTVELKHSRSLIKKYGLERAKYIVGYAVAKIKESDTDAKTFGYVLIFLNEALKSFESEQRKAQLLMQKKAEEEAKIRQVEAEEIEHQRYMEIYRSLPLEEQESMRQTAIESLKENKMRVTQLGVELKIEEMLKSKEVE